MQPNWESDRTGRKHAERTRKTAEGGTVKGGTIEAKQADRWLIVSDIDGTLVSYAKPELSPVTRRTLKALTDRGHIVALATGRHIRGVRRLQTDLGFHCPFVASNGAFVGDESHRLIEKNGFLPKDAARMIPVLHPLDMELYATIDDGYLYVDKALGVGVSDHSARAIGYTLVTDLQAYIHHPIYKFTLHGRASDVPHVAQTLQEQIGDIASVAISDSRTIDITPAGITKGTGLRTLATVHGIPLARTIAFGNEGNDVDLLQAAAIGVAVGDASDTAKAAADEVAAACDDDGVATWLRSFFDLDVTAEPGGHRQ